MLAYRSIRWCRTAASGDPHALLYDIGEHLQESVAKRFDKRVAPDGTPWAPVSDAYAKAKRDGEASSRSGAVRDPSQILQLTRDLRRTFRYQISGSELQQGSDRVYAASMQFGDPRQNLPARPWLGLSSEDEDAVRDIAKEHLQDALGSR